MTDTHTIQIGPLSGEDAVTMAEYMVKSGLVADSLIVVAHEASPQALFTGEQLNAAVNAGANLVLEDEGLFEGESSESIAAQDLVNLVANAAMHLLRHPGASLDEVIRASYQPDEDYCHGLEEGDDGAAECGSTGVHRPHVYTQDPVAKVRGWLA